MDVIGTLREAGLQARQVPLAKLQSVRRDIEGLLHAGELDRTLFEMYLSSYTYALPEAFPEARSLVIIAAPSPALRVRFETEDGVLEAVVPPTYADGKEVDARAAKAMAEAAPGLRTERAFLPLKTIATRSGLMRYGRNNIAYVEGMGSYFRLTAFFTELECSDFSWGEKMMLPACSKCIRCIEACPTGAIDARRFLVHAERCLTYLNELPAENEFPAPLPASAHNALIGCLRCQEACPYNSGSLQLREGPTFTREETSLLLREPTRADAALLSKLEAAGLDASVLPRNLLALLPR
jgi:epoxyqueuosine reductase